MTAPLTDRAPIVAPRVPKYRLLILAPGIVALIAGLLAGLARVGWTLPGPAADMALWHGPLMASAFFGTVISLERAVALDRPWAFIAPVAVGAGGVALVVGAPEPAGPLLLLLGSLGLLVASVLVWRRQPARFTATLAGGAAAWVVGNLLWLAGQPVAVAVPWWMAFLVLTVAGERLELSRFLPPVSWAGPAFLAVVALLVAGAAISDGRIFGAGLVLLALWLARFDIARRTMRLPGVTRYIAVCLLTGYGWLALGGVLTVAQPDAGAGGFRDAALHAVFVGFIFSMVFGHAPIILPAVLRLTLPFRRGFYLPLGLLSAGLALRVAGGLGDALLLRQWGSLANAVAIVLFIATMAAAIRAGRRPSTRVVEQGKLSSSSLPGEGHSRYRT